MARTAPLAPAATRPVGDALPARLLGALLAVAVVAIHVTEQGGVTGLKDPAYVGYGYWLLEIVALVCAGLLLAGRTAVGWFLALGVAAGPLAGFIVTRSVGLPNYKDDIGNWTEPIGVIAMVVEVVLLLLALAAYRRSAAR